MLNPAEKMKIGKLACQPAHPFLVLTSFSMWPFFNYVKQFKINLLFFFQDDFLLRHYDKGPCKNKLGHSRASVIWHRTQVIGIFAGFGILLLVASPLLLLAAPCIVCCKCRVCSGTKLDADDDLPEESGT